MGWKIFFFSDTSVWMTQSMVGAGCEGQRT